MWWWGSERELEGAEKRRQALGREERSVIDREEIDGWSGRERMDGRNITIVKQKGVHEGRDGAN